MSCSHRILTRSPQQTQDVGRALGEKARPGDVILLDGPLGAGKTCLTQGIAMGLGITGYVRSPTFVLMARYSGRLTLHHLDLYRVGSSQEAWDLGLDEQISGDGLCVVEWPDRAPDLFVRNGPSGPDAAPDGSQSGALWVKLAYSQTENSDTGDSDTGDLREIELSGGPKHYCGALAELAAKYPADNQLEKGGV